MFGLNHNWFHIPNDTGFETQDNHDIFAAMFELGWVRVLFSQHENSLNVDAKTLKPCRQAVNFYLTLNPNIYEVVAQGLYGMGYTFKGYDYIKRFIKFGVPSKQ